MIVDELLKTYREKEMESKAERLTFSGISDRDIYNITAPFHIDGKTYIAGRVERRDSEHSKVYFFFEEGEKWVLDESAPVFKLQDPFVTFINNELVFGGVEISESPEDPSVLEWRTIFYKGRNLNTLERIFVGPMGMKDIRLKQLADKQILVLTRPQGVVGGRGKIGITVIPSLDALSLEAIHEATLFDGLHGDEEWSGANEIHLLSDNKVGVLGHIAQFDEAGDRHYYAMTFEINLTNLQPTDLKIIAERKEFLPGPAKRPDLEDVIFSGGLLIEGELATLYAGISDAEAQKLTIPNPFI